MDELAQANALLLLVKEGMVKTGSSNGSLLNCVASKEQVDVYAKAESFELNRYLQFA